MKEISLSFTKFIELTEKYDYFIEQVFCLEDNCKCILLKTPKYSKLFLIYIPSKYIMEFPQNRNIVVNGREITDIKKDIFSYEIINKKPLEVITQYKLENLATVSSGLVCLYLNNKFECYTIGKSVGKRKNKDDELANLEYKTREILTKVKEFSKEKKEFLKPEDLKNLYAPPVDKSNAPNIVFVEDDGTVIEKNGPIEQMAVAAMGLSPKKETPPPEKVSLTETSKSIHDLEEKLSSKVAPEKVSKALRKLKREKRRQKALSLDEESEDISEDVSETSSIASTRHDSPEYKPKVHMEEIETQPNIGINMLPPEIELKNIMNGAIYVIVNINYFFSSIEEYETEIFAMYEKINTRDDEIRFEKMVNIETLIDEMKKKR